eukprot:5166550-Pleurochrysis_carterae.AAC.1
MRRAWTSDRPAATRRPSPAAPSLDPRPRCSPGSGGSSSTTPPCTMPRSSPFTAPPRWPPRVSPTVSSDV